ncbi:MAG: family 43 glycosylhydrolase [Roseateles asaccharophilus]|uniref:family 43 glycosylhydrolase n=1 Tax=Roseateles asaccharophilus TaxID=582607 RepID=UPI003918A16B
MSPAISRRRLLLASGGLGSGLLAGCTALPTPRPPLVWARGHEGQRRADLGTGRYLNPVLSGDRPDPTVLKDGRDYYMTHSSFEANPGLLIWHSRDLVNWQALGHALHEYLGSVWAPELIKHAGRYYLYIPTKHPRGNDIWVMHAGDIRGPWSKPQALGIDKIDPGHAVDAQGRRFLFLSAGLRVRLSDDGLRTVGPLEKVYEGWQYPEDWDVEGFAQEGPKMLWHRGWWHMTTALGGTAGPPTGHMVVHARARTLDGPWENSPYNPILRTRHISEAWWSRGHSTLVEGPRPGDWYMMLHGYENGYRNLGRQTLLEPIEWTADGWYRSPLADAGSALPMPAGGEAVPHGMALSDDFDAPSLGPQWSFFRGDALDAQRLRVGQGQLSLAGRGDGPGNGAPLCFVSGDRHYQVEVDMDLDPQARAGLILFYNDKLYAGLGVDKQGFWLHRYGQDQRRGSLLPGQGRRLRMRLTLREHILTLHTRHEGESGWRKYGTQMEVSGYHHNVAGGFMSLRPALYAAGQGRVRFSKLRYQALD